VRVGGNLRDTERDKHTLREIDTAREKEYKTYTHGERKRERERERERERI
jgi:hypothetical protein